MDNMTLFIDPVTRDLCIDDDGDFQKIYDDETTAQCVRVTLEVYKGEFPLDIDHGVDYERIMGQKGITYEETAGIIREAVYQEKKVKRIESISVEKKTEGDRRVVASDVVTLTSDNSVVSVSTGVSG